uniref:Uncharacterized protein n=1 Tax=Arundo donax TaxID=35708 RepID=A0A0A9H343_ARUDO
MLRRWQITRQGNQYCMMKNHFINLTLFTASCFCKFLDVEEKHIICNTYFNLFNPVDKLDNL